MTRFALLALAALTLAASAAAGHKSPSGTISLDQDPATLSLGSEVTFTTTVEGLHGGEYPMVYVECYSDESGLLVYGQLDHPDATFVLGGGSSDWRLVGGPASCLAHLYSYGGRDRGQDVIVELAIPVGFHADG